MNQSFSVTVSLQQSVERIRAAFLNRLDILKELFIIDTFKRNISYK